jgi:organic hydroperoxide reductase OsmC/OhrA
LKAHEYHVSLDWTGNRGAGTSTYRGYSRDHDLRAEGRPVIGGSSDPAFRGDPSRYSPEDLLVGSLSACHMLSYLHLCSANRISVLEYRDRASGWMEVAADGSGRLVRAILRPHVRIAPGGDPARARALHEEAHRLCFIANSVNFPVEVEGGDVIQDPAA